MKQIDKVALSIISREKFADSCRVCPSCNGGGGVAESTVAGRVRSIMTVMGYVAVVWSEIGLWELSFPRPSQIEALADIKVLCISPSAMRENECVNYDSAVEAVSNRWMPELEEQLGRYCNGESVQFTMPIDWRGYTKFRRDVLQYAVSIPYGKVETYGYIARKVGYPRAARAVGGAMHNNRTPIIVPCHRVVGSKGELVGFGGGLELKKQLLILEKALPL